jgi:hypothetical protein
VLIWKELKHREPGSIDESQKTNIIVYLLLPVHEAVLCEYLQIWQHKLTLCVCFVYKLSIIMTFVGPCIVIYFYSKTNQMQNISNLFYFGTTLYMFRTVSPSIIKSLGLYIQHQVYVTQVLWLLADIWFVLL